MKKTLNWILCCLAFIGAQPSVAADRPEFKQYFDKYRVEGSFVLYDLKKNSAYDYNLKRCNKAFTPASTFKIFNSLVAIETGAIGGAHDTIRWDGVGRQVPDWNRDHDLQSAFKFSVVWYYQELARRIGAERMRHYIDTVGYGNRDISGAIDGFWLDGKLRISQMEQIDLLVKLYQNRLPFSPRTMNIVKNIMIMEDTLGYRLRAKTGWGSQDGKSIAWYVGYIERGDNVYFFATNFETKKQMTDALRNARIEITKKILKDLRIL